MPYLRIYDGQKGSSEAVIDKPEFVIGRQAGVDVVIDDGAVSRRHAVIKPYNELHMIEDAGSRTGTFINGHKMPCCQLAHEVAIQIGPCTLEYRTDDASRTAAQASDNPMGRMLRQNFSLLPNNVQMRFRTIAGRPADLFKTGDTLDFGGGGMLLPMAKPLKQGQCIEVEIVGANGNARTYLGEVLEVLQDHALPELCIKLHFLSRQKHEAATQKAGDWVQAWPAA